MKKLKRLLALSLVATIALSGCGKKQEDVKISSENEIAQTTESTENQSEQNIEVVGVEEEVTTPVVSSTNKFGGITIAELKNKYGMSDDNYIKPFYNVEQNTQFTFNFKSKVEPIEAVTVHTDPKCEVNSTVYQINSAYENDNGGYDIIVKPGKPVLNSSDREGGELDNYNWGNAPVYYISINYDMNATTPTKLDTPIIVPFTIKNTISTPNLTASIDSNGKFQLNWKAVTGATKYKIYEAYRVRESSSAYNMTRAEAGYVGDHLQLLATVDSNTLTFDDFHDNDGTHNTQVDSYGFTSSQNFFDLGSYYVTAVDGSGNESFFSLAVTGWQYYSQLPKSFDPYSYFSKNESGYVIYLPETVPVTMADKSTHYFPIEYTKTSEFMYGTVQYNYHIIGTELTGKLEYYKADKIYAMSITPTEKLSNDLYVVQNNINIIPDVSANTLTDTTYSNVNIDLGKSVTRDESKAVKYSQEALLKRADIESARVVNDGVYTQPEGPLGMLVECTLINTNKSTNTVVEESNNTTPTEITSDNLVQEQINSTDRQVEQANKESLPEITVRLFADTAEEEYLAINMIAANTAISLEAFPMLQNTEYLYDVIMKVVYQNPYIIGFKVAGYDYNTMTLIVEYDSSADQIHTKQATIATEAQNIINTIIKDGMSDEDKVTAIWDYFEKNTEYDKAALKYAEQNNFTDVSGYEDSFNSYGIMCKKIGVCQSYAYCLKILLSMCDVPCITLTGYMDQTLPHAWNAVYIDNAWRWIDSTNNITNSGIPYMLYQTSSINAEKNAYVLDDFYELNSKLDTVYSNDNSKDWYVKNDMYASSQSEMIKILADNYDKFEDYACVKCDIEPTYDEAFLTELARVLYSNGVSEEEIYNLRMGYTCGIFVIVK